MDLLIDQWERTEESLLEELQRNGMLPEPKISLPPVVEEKPTYKLPIVSLYPHQQKAADELGNGKILVGGVGVGKSRTAGAYYMAKEAPRDVYVITTAKKRDELDWNDEFHRFGVSAERNPGFTGALVVDSWNNIGRYVDAEDSFFIFDEQRLVGSGAWTKSFLKIAKRNHWIMLSATPGDTWLDYIPVFVANGFYKNRTWFKREHVVYNTYSKFPKVDRYTGVNKLLKLRHSIQVEMPYVRHTTRHTHYIEVDHDKELMHRAMVDRWHVYEERPIRDVAELFSVMRKIVNSDPSRIEAVRWLMKKHPKLIIFYNFNYELDMLRELGNLASLVSGQADGSRSTELSSQPSSGSMASSTPSSTTSTMTLTSGSKSNQKTPNDSSKSKEVRPSLPEDLTNLSLTQTSSTHKTMESPRAIATSLTSPSQTLGKSSDRLRTTSKLSGVSDQSSASLKPLKCDTLRLTSTPETSFAVAEWNGHKHEPIPKTDSWVYLVQYVAGSEGWNCTETDATVMYSLTYSFKNWHQAYGRIDRINTPYTDLNYYVLRSKSAIDSAIMKSLKEKKNFNEKTLNIVF
jgi:hypothetical protein